MLADSTLAETLSRQAARFPDKAAFRFLDHGGREREALTYGALNRRALAIARAIHAGGYAGRRIVLAYPPGLDVVSALFGCFHAGATAILAPASDHGRGLDRILAILDDADAACILASRTVANQPGFIPDQGNLPCIFTDELPLDHGEAVLAAPRPEAIALLQYTSGSTGHPRAVMLTHANLIHQQAVLACALGSTPADIAVSWLPLYHDMGLVGAVLQSVHVGGTCVMMAPLSFLQRPLRWLQAISQYRATVSMAPTFAYELCTRFGRRPDAATLDLSSWRVAICGGETVRPQALQAFAACFEAAGFDRRAIMPAYGLAEATLLATSVPPGSGLQTYGAPGGIAGSLPAPGTVFACCGKPWLGQQLAIVDPETSREHPAGEAGEIWLQGPSVAVGYWNRPAETTETFHAQRTDQAEGTGWLRTGDLGYLCADGLVVTGRRKDLIIVRGANINPHALETLAAACDDGLTDAAAFAIEQDDGTRVILMQEVSRAALRAIDAAGVTGKVAAAISRDFGLTLYDYVLLRPGALPRTTSGKIQRHLCRKSYLAGDMARLPPIEHPALARCRPGRTMPG
jgi:acyl-CoA synthetase (AMP-forming)/AMP-acid ligase II